MHLPCNQQPDIHHDRADMDFLLLFSHISRIKRKINKLLFHQRMIYIVHGRKVYLTFHMFLNLESWLILKNKDFSLKKFWVMTYYLHTKHLLFIKARGLYEWVSDYRLNAKWAIFHLYNGGNKLHLMGRVWCTLCTRPICLGESLAHCNNNLQVDILIHANTNILILIHPVFAISPRCCVLSGEAANNNSNAICLYRRIWLVTILRKVLNLQVITKSSSWKDPPSWKCEILHNNNTQK
jgi:hypothetical protein